MGIRKHSRVFASAIALLGAIAMSFTALPANAATSTPTYGNINPAQQGSIIIHKHEYQNGTSATANPDGTGEDKLKTATIANVQFTVYAINGLDLSKSGSWAGLDKAVAPSSVTADTKVTVNGSDYSLKKVAQVTTDGNGLATAAKLPVAAYVVVETQAPANIVDMAAPFIVTIPFPDNASSKGWLYDVNVYPKNAQTSINKQVLSPTSFGLGSTTQYQVTSKVPTIGSDQNFKYFIIDDVFDSRMANPAVDAVSMVTYMTDAQGNQVIDTTKTSAVDAKYYKVTTSGQQVDVSFNKAGLAWLKTQPGANIMVSFSAKVNGIGNGTIPNTAKLYTDAEVSPNPPDTPPTVPPTNPPYTPPTSPTVYQYWGDALIRKYDANDMSGNKSNDKKAGLSGAEFQVYNISGEKHPDSKSCNDTSITGDPISVNGQSSFTSDANGVVNISGLFVNDSVGGDKSDTVRCYVLKETKAPAGYILPSGNGALTPLTVKAGQTTITNGAGYDQYVGNTKQNGPNLPLTGSTGIAVMVIVGVALLGGAGALLAKRRFTTSR